MKHLLTRTVTLIRDTMSGRRRLARYQDPEAHRRAAHNPDLAIVKHYIPGPGNPPRGGAGM
ncbi:hypothetical protein [Streptomyces sp. NBC_01190]|uniref:hypothetical protein n=1 Tax=Streptomyces sp. NBC_01190 TaxID=2903767 RepID=UPI00386CE3C0|nr:hypothetical protein OG519_31485 [Streptomyces sp. NBC_01190]